MGIRQTMGSVDIEARAQVRCPVQDKYVRTLQPPRFNNAGGSRPCRQASMQSLRKVNTSLPCCRQVCTTVSTRSTNRLPCGLSVPPLVLRHSTPCRSALSPALLVGSTPSTSTNFHSHCPWASNSRHVPAVLLQPHALPRRNTRRSACRTVWMATWNRGRDSVPCFNWCHR